MSEFADIHCVADVARVQARVRPDAVALTFEGRNTTFAELDARASQVAQALLAQGLQPGDRISTLTKNNDWFMALWLGAAKARVTLAPVNWRLAPPEVAFILKDAGSKMLFVGADFADTVDMIAGELPELRGLVHFEPGHPRWPSFDDWANAYPAEDPMLAADPDDDVIQLYTSGTTGLPKGVQLTEAAYAGLLRLARDIGWSDHDPGKTALDCMPLFHVAGVNMAITSLAAGARVLIVRDVNPAELVKLIPEERVAYAFLAPTIINMILQQPGVDEADFSHLELVSYGASPIAEETLKRAKAVFGAKFIQLYGLTETLGCGAHLPPADHDEARGKLRACGKAWPEYELRLVKPDGSVAAPGEVGEVHIKGPSLMKGYWNRPKATAEAIDADGWFRSGDAAYMDAEGYLFIHDRVKDMIVSGGENVYPAEVENALFSHPDVADAAVVGVPDDKWGEAVKAFVVLRPGCAQDPAAIIAHCREKIAGYKTPKSVDFIPVLPRNPSGKVLRRELRAPFWEGRERQVG